MKFGISGDTYGYYKNGQLVGFKSQADIDAAYQSGYTAGVAAGETTHTGTYNITSNGTTDLGVHHTYRYIDTSVYYVPTKWSTGSIADIQAFFNNPNINISDYWSVGDARIETSSAVAGGSTSQTWVLTDLNSYTSGGTYYNAIIHTVNLFSQSFYMNSTDTTTGGWNQCHARVNVIPTIYNSINSNFKSLIKTVSNISNDGSLNDNNQTTSDNLWFFSEHEVINENNHSAPSEYAACKQFDYFTIDSNRVKAGALIGSYSNWWWLRSPAIKFSGYFSAVTCGNSNNGKINMVAASTALGVCVAAAI